MSNLRYLIVPLAALSLFAGVGLWYGNGRGVVTLVVSPRRFVSVMPGTTTNFTAVAWWDDAHCCTVSTAGAAWQCAPAVGLMSGNQLFATNAAPSYGWVQATFGGLATRAYVKVSADGTWNPDMDEDGDGLSDAQEIASNTSPAETTLTDVQCTLY